MIRESEWNQFQKSNRIEYSNIFKIETRIEPNRSKNAQIEYLTARLDVYLRFAQWTFRPIFTTSKRRSVQFEFRF